MARVIKTSVKFKPITCFVCGSVYEFEKGDKIHIDEVSWLGKSYICCRLLDCPICGQENKLVECDGEEE